MRIGFEERTPGGIDFALLFGGIALLCLAAFRFLPIAVFSPACVWHGLFGVPCPTCGTTRSLVCLADGDIVGALRMNPLASLAVLALVGAFALGALVRLSGLRFVIVLSEREKMVLRAVAVLLLILNWGYLVLDGR